MALPRLVALDFDGVVCDGLREYFQAAWRAYGELWPHGGEPEEAVEQSFYRLRPVIETGWEMPLLIAGLRQGLSETEVLADWGAIAQDLLARSGLESVQLAAAVDGVRDRWIRADVESWLGLHRFYPGVIAQVQRLLASEAQIVIISTKEGRFIRQLLAREGIRLGDRQVWGKEVRQPKSVSLRQLKAEYQLENTQIWFVEDRLATLEKVQLEPDLAGISLFLANWGYNTPQERLRAAQNPSIQLLTLDDFCQFPD